MAQYISEKADRQTGCGYSLYYHLSIEYLFISVSVMRCTYYYTICKNHRLRVFSYLYAHIRTIMFLNIDCSLLGRALQLGVSFLFFIFGESQMRIQRQRQIKLIK